MHDHGSNYLEGPIRGSSAWWRRSAPQSEPAEQPAHTTRNKSSKMESSGIRKELVHRIRGEIAAGTYDTPDKWEAALDRLLGGLDTD